MKNSVYKPLKLKSTSTKDFWDYRFRCKRFSVHLCMALRGVNVILLPWQPEFFLEFSSLYICVENLPRNVHAKFH